MPSNRSRKAKTNLVSNPVPTFSREDELVSLEKTYQQRAQADATALWIGEPANYQLLGRFAFHL
jgi:hypothetical protein